MVTVKKSLDDAAICLDKAGVENPRLDSRLLLESVLNISHEDLILKSDAEINDADYQNFLKLIDRRKKREPVSRILGYRYFWKSKFFISKETLDPRADTEILVEQVVKYCSENGLSNILDLGTGSGCILLSLLQEFAQTKGVGIDLSADAIKTSNKNANALNLEDRAEFINCSWNDFIPNCKFDAVVSNPPYIIYGDIKSLEDEVKEYDPIRALSGGSDGLECYREIVKLLPNFLKKSSWVFFEIGYNQGYDVQKILADGGFTILEIVKDLAGCDRCIVARLN